jgi:hypothetical protein
MLYCLQGNLHNIQCLGNIEAINPLMKKLSTLDDIAICGELALSSSNQVKSKSKTLRLFYKDPEVRNICLGNTEYDIHLYDMSYVDMKGVQFGLFCACTLVAPVLRFFLLPNSGSFIGFGTRTSISSYVLGQQYCTTMQLRYKYISELCLICSEYNVITTCKDMRTGATIDSIYTIDRTPYRIEWCNRYRHYTCSDPIYQITSTYHLPYSEFYMRDCNRISSYKTLTYDIFLYQLIQESSQYTDLLCNIVMKLSSQYDARIITRLDLEHVLLFMYNDMYMSAIGWTDDLVFNKMVGDEQIEDLKVCKVIPTPVTREFVEKDYTKLPSFPTLDVFNEMFLNDTMHAIDDIDINLDNRDLINRYLNISELINYTTTITYVDLMVNILRSIDIYVNNSVMRLIQYNRRSSVFRILHIKKETAGVYRISVDLIGIVLREADRYPKTVVDVIDSKLYRNYVEIILSDDK